MCGIPFSEVSPTTSYTPIADHIIQKALRLERWRWFGIAFSFALALVLLQLLFSYTRRQHEIGLLEATPRKIGIYQFDLEAYAPLPPAIKRLSLGFALQGFQDHFQMNLSSLTYTEGQVPESLSKFFDEIKNLSTPGNFIEGEVLPFMRLSFWEKTIFPKLTEQWSQNPHAELPVIITNFPLYADPEEETKIETRHLGKARLVSGLGHPALVLISTFRMNDRSNKHADDLPKLKTVYDYARYLGEYVLAHELGHALLGLTDTVVDPVQYSPPSKKTQSLRMPASINSTGPEINQCLMHTDSGGGHHAWANLRDREIGISSTCQSYSKTVEAFQKRSESIQLLKLGFHNEARIKHQEAMDLIQTHSQPWIGKVWSQEIILFSGLLSFF